MRLPEISGADRPWPGHLPCPLGCPLPAGVPVRRAVLGHPGRRPDRGHSAQAGPGVPGLGGLAFIPRPQPGDVVGRRAFDVVGGLVAGVLLQAGDVEPGAVAVPATGQLQVRVRDGRLDRGDDLGVAGRVAGRDVVGAVAEPVGQLQEGDGPAGVFDVAQVEGVLGPGGPDQPGEVGPGAPGRGVDECGAGKNGSSWPRGPQVPEMR